MHAGDKRSRHHIWFFLYTLASRYYTSLALTILCFQLSFHILVILRLSHSVIFYPLLIISTRHL
ncbi:hypothetical protein F5051DRAFT_65626 [Lentinula edodes]|nr:hypothetical protein F5051DRAFT_65626 [Lentinula edodes]